MNLRRRKHLGEAIGRVAVGYSLDRVVDKAEDFASKIRQSRFLRDEQLEFAEVLSHYAQRLLKISALLRRK